MIEIKDPYERGFIDGMQEQMKRSVDRAVNAMTKPWVGLTDEEIQDSSWQHFVTNQWPTVHMVVRKLEAKLKEKNA